MEFKKALEALKSGLKIKLPHWSGYWAKEENTVKMYCKNGDVLDIRETEDVFYTLSNIASDEWEVVEETDIDLAVKTFHFGEAIRLIRQGKKVARKVWNGKEMFLAHGDDIQSCTGIGNKCADVICMKTAQNTVVFGWFASQTDIFADDWQVVE